MNRRRAHNDDDEGYDGENRKRRCVSENQKIENRLESLILRVGEKSTSTLESNLEGLVSVLEAELSYHQRMREMMPDTYSKLLPKPPAPSFKYTSENAASLPGTAIAHQLVQAIRQKCTPDEVLRILNDLPNPENENENENEMIELTFNPLKIDVFVQTLLNLESKSFFGSFAAIAKFHRVFKAIAESEEAQICLLHNVYELWSTHQQMMCVLIEKLLETQIIECSAVAIWIFSKEMNNDFTKMYLWEILHLAIKKMNKHVIKLGSELYEAKEKLSRAALSLSSDFEEEDKNNDEKPTEEMVKRMEEKLEAADVDQKRLFLIVFKRFIMILSEHFLRCGHNYDTDWYRWTIGRLQQVFITHHEQVQKYSSTLKTLLFTSKFDLHLLDIFEQFQQFQQFVALCV